MDKIRIQCKHCNGIFQVNALGKPGIYNTNCPHCKQKMKFRILPPYQLGEQTLSAQRSMTVRCPQCEAMFPAFLPSNPGCYGTKCPSCKQEIRVKMI